jgi:hypothetical protein
MLQSTYHYADCRLTECCYGEWHIQAHYAKHRHAVFQSGHYSLHRYARC